jgi:hypothetical protein
MDVARVVPEDDVVNGENGVGGDDSEPVAALAGDIALETLDADGITDASDELIEDDDAGS